MRRFTPFRIITKTNYCFRFPSHEYHTPFITDCQQNPASEVPMKIPDTNPQDIFQSALNNIQNQIQGNLPIRSGKHGIIAFGIGKDEHGRNMAKFGKIIKNDAGDTTEEKYIEKCLDPEQEKLNEKSQEPSSIDENCIEVESFNVAPSNDK